MKISDGAVISGNHPITQEEWDHRIETFHRPYHDAVAATVDSVANATGRAPLVLSLHSFTPAWKGTPRPWHAAVLWDSDHRAVGPLLDMPYEDWKNLHQNEASPVQKAAFELNNPHK